MMTRGFSEAAQIVDEASRRNRERLAETVTFSRQPTFDELWDVWNNCREGDWDIHGADPVMRDTLRNAYEFIEALPPGCPLPSIGSEPDGHITLEWYRSPSWLLSVSVSPEGVLYYAALLGDEDPRGSCRFDGEIPETILYWIRRVGAA